MNIQRCPNQDKYEIAVLSELSVELCEDRHSRAGGNPGVLAVLHPYFPPRREGMSVGLCRAGTSTSPRPLALGKPGIAEPSAVRGGYREQEPE